MCLCCVIVAGAFVSRRFLASADEGDVNGWANREGGERGACDGSFARVHAVPRTTKGETQEPALRDMSFEISRVAERSLKTPTCARARDEGRGERGMRTR